MARAAQIPFGWAISWSLAAFWWIADRLYGDRVFDAIKPMIPSDWLMASNEVLIRQVITFGPPFALVALGSWLFMRFVNAPRLQQGGMVGQSQEKIASVTREFDRVDGWSLAISPMGVTITSDFPDDMSVAFQRCRFVNLSMKQSRVIDMRLEIPTPDWNKDSIVITSEFTMIKTDTDCTPSQFRHYGSLIYPITIPPGQVVEGQIKFDLTYEDVKKLRSEPLWIYGATIFVTEHRAGRTVSFKAAECFSPLPPTGDVA